ncbi:DivIVA domain-containing protein [Natronosporangium hydrolyticum]|uniref:DivIVA domain-containing protein n=1 Tax=Natronosporangium hydrolyticum TaxID=2811111 RepID=A0A895Y8M8_9ACTN|nr:DivIVA domain-containing protein [Natronosporangium hydrolyticum]QSB14094.1 DivIVA domain-containing protein [Natronosporangium hydrolyticum]
MSQFLLVVAVALTVGGVVFGVTMLLSGDDRGLRRAEPDGRAVPLPEDRPLLETDVANARFDPALRGYRMAQVDVALRRAAYDIGYKEELIRVLQAEVAALRAGRTEEAHALQRARDAALAQVAALEAEPAAESAAAIEAELTAEPEATLAAESPPESELAGEPDGAGRGAP